MTEITIGVDISKEALDAYRFPAGESRRFDNTAKGHKALMRWIGARPARVVYEPTGAYHRGFECRLAEAGLPLVKVNPRQARRFAEATGKLAKTDRCDAAMLARMGAALALAARPPRSELLNDLKDLHMARAALIKDRTAARNRAKTLALALLKRHNGERLKQIQRQLSDIDQSILTLIKADPDLAQRLDILISIPSLSQATACALIIDMPELGTLEPPEAASLAGLAPVARQSGTWTGRAFIRGGRANVRQALYMPALVAMRFNPDLKAKYQALKAAGKPPKVAITALMRKLIILANALLKAQRKWTPKPT
jgi:transposase